MHSYAHAYVCFYKLTLLWWICICNAFDDDMMCLLSISLLLFDDTCATLLEIICYAMVKCMLGWSDMYARWMLGSMLWWYAWLDEC